MPFLKKIPLRFWIIFCLCVVIFSLSYFRAFENYELLSYDLRLKLRPSLSISKDIIVIEISDDTLKNLGTWPLPRDFHASLVDVLREFGAKIIVFDILFSTPTVYDEVFSQAINNAKNVYLSLAFHIKDKPNRNNFLPIESNKILEGISYTLEKSPAGQGHINVYVDADGKTRTIPLFIKYNQILFPHLGFKAACDWLGLNLKNIEFKKDKLIIGNKLSLPISNGCSFIVNYPDTWEKSFIHLSYFEILKAYTDIKNGLKPKLDLSVIKNKACFIGLTAAGTSDLKPTPLENIYPMLGLQASVFNSLLQKKFIIKTGLLFNSFINILIFLIGLLLCLKLSPLKASFANIIFASSYFFVAAFILVFYGVWIDLFLPLFIIAFTFVGSTVYKFLQEIKKRQLLEKELDIAREIQRSFLPKDIKEISDLDMALFMQPAKFVAGDFYDVLVLDDKKIVVAIGDVAGKGVPAALIMAQTISFLRIFSRQYLSCSEVLSHLNKELSTLLSGRFITCLYMIIDIQKHKVYVCSAGHSPLFVYKKNESKILEVDLSSELPLGITQDIDYKEINFDIEKNDKIIIFTDGITEARNKKGREFGLDNIKKIILDNANLSSSVTLEVIKNNLFKFSQGCPQHDDITLLVLSLKN